MTHKKANLIKIFLFVIVLYLQHLMISYGTSMPLRITVLTDIRWQLLSLAVIGIFSLILMCIIGKLWISLLISSTIVFLLALINYHIVLFHGSPFFAADIFSFHTALNVAGQYNLVLDHVVLRVAVIYLVILLAVFLMRKVENSKKQRVRLPYAVALIFNLGVTYFLLFGALNLFPSNLVKWTWHEGVSQYGYEICLANSIYTLQNKFNKPESYSVEELNSELDRLKEKAKGSSEVYPDIILILNESLCNINFYGDVPESEDIFKPIKENKNIFSGNTTVSLVGGGTNNSEYELLSSNSMTGLTFTAPFTYLDMRNADSIVTYMEQLGYGTIGMHCALKTNYNRNVAYYAMGFDEVYLGQDQFKHVNSYYNRQWLDSDNYEDLLEAMSEMQDKPCFAYLLTMQNHGGYDQNPEEADTIRVKGDYGALTSQINEYLSSIKLSVEAFISLTNCLQDSDRPTIVVMLGDHAPSFINDLPSNKSRNETEMDLAKKTVPLLVWSNYDIDSSVLEKNSSVVDIMPMILKAVGLPLSPYYQAILELNQKLPVRTANGAAIDSDGAVFREINQDSPVLEEEEIYLQMEYNNLKCDKDYIAELFEVD